MALTARRPLYVAAIIERFDNHMLILRQEQCADGTGVWRFPRGMANPGESAEAAMRRVARESLGLDIEVVVGQPPLLEKIDGTLAELRYFFCGILRGEPKSADGAEVRWVSKAHLREYDFEPPTRIVVDWLLES